ncbi:uncharacterized protein [Pagrus major]|uniref:uncharacterized protein isoform X2 n=1 Tax=Pagrus major TaxID=143350 RepID=UPI003CC86B69
MAYRHGRVSIREAYEDHFSGMDARDSREVKVHRVVNIVEKRNPMPRPGVEYDRGYDDDQWYGGPRNYPGARESHGEDGYPPSDRRYYEDSHSYRRSSPSPRNEGPYSQQSYSRDDLRHQLGSRHRGRPGPQFRNRGRGSGPPRRQDRSDHRSSPPVVVKRDRSPVSREAQPPVRSGSNTSSRSFSPDRDKGHTHQQAQKKHKSNVPTSHTPSSSVEGSPHSSGSSKEKTPASVAETEEVVAASMEPKLTSEEDFKARRLEAIKAKALEIEKHYRQDCETFRTVVKMLVTKEPSLDNLLQAPLDANLSEIKQRCLDDLRHFVKELDEAITHGRDGPNHGSSNISSATHVPMKEDITKLCSITPTSTDRKQEGGKQPGNTGDSAHVTAWNQGGGQQTGNTENSSPGPEIHVPARQENLATPGPEDSYSEPIKLLSVSTPPPAQQGPIEDFTKRLQLYSHRGEKFSNCQLSDPTAWPDITYARPGWVPDSLPYLQIGERYWELKAESTFYFAKNPAHVKGQMKEKVACGLTFYNHDEGPWCEVQSENGARICILAAPPSTTHIPPMTGQEPVRTECESGC